MASIELQRVSKAFHAAEHSSLAVEVAKWPRSATSGEARSPALDEVDLSLADGESLAILGPSGCGKTTLLRVIAGLEPPNSGCVLFDGEEVTSVGAEARGIGMVFQNYALYPNMNSQGNLGFFFRMHRRQAESPERVDAVCEVMGPGFRPLLLRKPSQLSGGEQQRVAIGRCIIRQPRAFLFDEPLANLDAKLRSQTRVEIRRLIRRFGITTVYVTHDQAEAIAICDRLGVMRRGRIEQTGTCRELYDRPANVFVAGFLGSPPMNLLEGTISAEGDTVRAGEAVALLIPPALRHLLAPGSPVTVGLRPEALRFAPEDGLEAEGAIVARAIVSEPLIPERQQLVTCALGSDGAEPEIVAKLPGGDRVAPGTPLRLKFDPDALYLFDAAGRRVGALEPAPAI